MLQMLQECFSVEGPSPTYRKKGKHSETDLEMAYDLANDLDFINGPDKEHQDNFYIGYLMRIMESKIWNTSIF